MKIIAIALNKGGVGKTSLTISFAHALMNEGKKVLVIDMDPQSTLSDRITSDALAQDGIQKGQTIYDALKDGKPLPIVSVRPDLLTITNNAEDAPCIDIVPGSLKMEGCSLLEVEEEDFVLSLLSKLVEPLPKDYDYVLLDCPPAAGACTKLALNAADEVILVVPAGGAEIDGLNKMIKFIEIRKRSDNPDLKLAGILINKWDGSSTGKKCIAMIDEMFPGKRYRTMIRDSKAFGTALNNKVSVFDLPVKGNSVIDIMNFTNEYLTKR